MSEWKEIELRDVCSDISYGYTASANDSPIGPKFLRITDVAKGRINWETVPFCIINEKDSAKYKLEIGDIVIARTGATTGYNAIIKNEIDAVFASYLIRFKINKNIAEPFYVGYVLQSNRFQDYVNAIAGGSAQPGANAQQFADFEFLLPTLSEQIQIASILSSLDDKIDLLHRQNKTLEQLAATLFRQWFMEEAEDIWEEVSLGEYISVKHGYAFKGNCISTEPTDLILVTPGNFKIGGGFKFDKFKYYTSDEFPTDYIFKTGDMVVTMTDLSVQGDSLGYPAIIPENHANELYLHNQRVGKIEFKKEISKSFIYQLMKTRDYQWFILGGASGTAIRHTSPTSICSYSFLLPTKQRLLDYERFALGIEEKIKANQNQIRTLVHLRDTLLPKLMSGEVKVLL